MSNIAEAAIIFDIQALEADGPSAKTIHKYTHTYLEDKRLKCTDIHGNSFIVHLRNSTTNTDTHTDAQIHTHTDAQTNTHTAAEINTHTNDQTNTHTDDQIHTHTDDQINTHTDAQINTHTNTHLDTHTYTHPDTVPFDHVLPILAFAPDNPTYSITGDYGKLYRHEANRLWPERVCTAWTQLPSFVFEITYPVTSEHGLGLGLGLGLGFVTKPCVITRGAGGFSNTGLLKVVEVQPPVSSMVKIGDLVLSINGLSLSGNRFDANQAEALLANPNPNPNLSPNPNPNLSPNPNLNPNPNPKLSPNPDPDAHPHVQTQTSVSAARVVRFMRSPCEPSPVELSLAKDTKPSASFLLQGQLKVTHVEPGLPPIMKRLMKCMQIPYVLATQPPSHLLPPKDMTIAALRPPVPRKLPPGVFFDRNKWVAQVEAAGKQVFLGRFSNESEAVKACAAANEAIRQGRSFSSPPTYSVNPLSSLAAHASDPNPNPNPAVNPTFNPNPTNPTPILNHDPTSIDPSTHPHTHIHTVSDSVATRADLLALFGTFPNPNPNPNRILF